MNRVFGHCLVGLVIVVATVATSSGAVITFTGGTVTRLDATTETTNNSVVWDNVDYYEEDGFKFDFIPNAGSGGSATHVGNYYGARNDVIHLHWSSGILGGVTSVEITKVGGGTFDVGYFILTSNAELGNGAASGLERAWVEGFNSSNVSTGAPVLLPSEDCGFPATQIFLGSNFAAVAKVVFSVTNRVDCFGMDEFYLTPIPEPPDEPPQPAIPEPSTLIIWSLLGSFALAIGWWRKRQAA